MPSQKVATVLFVAMVLSPVLAIGQNQPRTTAQSIRGHFASINKRVLDMAKDFPEDK
jgi:hypothetical protein